jgi:hypothetical protein
MVIEMIDGEPPFFQETPWEAMKRIQAGHVPNVAQPSKVD